MEQSILEWALAVIGSGGIGAVITYICTFKSKKNKQKLKPNLQWSMLSRKTDLKQDQYDYLQKACDKYIKDYHELEGDFRKQISELREQMDKIMLEKSQAISAKCNEIATLKSKVTYLKGIRCYNFTCKHRIMTNPDKTEE